MLRPLPGGGRGGAPVRDGAPVRGGRAAALGYLLDRAVGEPPARLHPVAGFGALMGRAERRCYRPTRPAGVAYAGTGLLAAAAGAALVPSVTAWCYLALGGRSLESAATAVAEALAQGDLPRARSLLPALVGRDVAQLDAAGIARAVVESVAENTNDAVVAPLCYAATGRPLLVAVHRAANTMDAMVGYRDERYRRFGWASARLDDVLGYLPARVTALAVLLARPSRAGAVVRSLRRDAPHHPSPNGGVAEAAFAAALGLRLGGPASYGGVAETRPLLGDGRPPEPADLAAALDLARDVGRLVAAAAALLSAGRARLGGRRRG